MGLSICILCYDGIGHVMPAYHFAQRLVHLIKEDRLRYTKRGTQGPKFLAADGQVFITLFCQVAGDDLDNFMTIVRPSKEIELVVRVLGPPLSAVNNDNAERSEGHVQTSQVEDKARRSTHGGSVFRNDAKEGKWFHRVVSFYRNGFDSVLERSRFVQRYRDVRFDREPQTRFLFMSLRPDPIDVNTPLTPIPNAIVCDMFVPFDGDIAAELGGGLDIPCWSFHPSSLVVAGFNYESCTLDLNGMCTFEDCDLMDGIKDDYGGMGFIAETERRPHRRGIIVNDVEEWYDYDTLDAVRHCRPSRNKPWEVLCVGPLFMSVPRPEADTSRALSNFLRQRKSGYLAYFTMGSLFPINANVLEQLSGLAEFLLQRGVPVVWSLRGDAYDAFTTSNAYSWLRNNNSLFVSPWVNQVAVLRHPSLSLVVTHAGWNGILEIMASTTARIICYPLGAEQGINARCVTSFFKTGITFSTNELMYEEMKKPNPSVYVDAAREAVDRSSKKNLYKFIYSLL